MGNASAVNNISQSDEDNNNYNVYSGTTNTWNFINNTSSPNEINDTYPVDNSSNSAL